uniref:Uncharacterized protein n=1 Tax=Glossina palpalis gambiensis TaxID=67801 RepID=A0A1B0C7D7_9MUSC
MKFFILTIIIVGAVFAGYVDLIHAATLPDYVIPCKRNDPNIEKCIVNAVNHIKPHLKNGIKDLNVPAMEPLSLGTLNILESGSSGINVKAIDLNIYGASNFEIRKFKISDDGLRYDFELNLPHLEGEGHYDISGKILTLPIKGRGPFTGNFGEFSFFLLFFFFLLFYGVSCFMGISTWNFNAKERLSLLMSNTSKNGIVGHGPPLNILRHPTVVHMTVFQNKPLYGERSKAWTNPNYSQ